MSTVLMRAKFEVEKIERTSHAEQLSLRAVYGGATNGEDNTFSAATPNATMSMTISNKSLWGKINPGDKLYVDFTVAPATQ